MALMSFVCAKQLSPPQGSFKENLEIIPGSVLRTALVQTRTIQVMSVIQGWLIYLSSNVVKLWACLVTVETNKAIMLLCGEGKKEKFSTIVLRRHEK